MQIFLNNLLLRFFFGGLIIRELKPKKFFLREFQLSKTFGSSAAACSSGSQFATLVNSEPST